MSEIVPGAFYYRRVASGGVSADTLTSDDIGSTVQAHNDNLDTFAALTHTSGGIPVSNGSVWTIESGSTARASLGLTIGTNVQAASTRLSEIAALTPSNGAVVVGDGSSWVAESGGTARTSLGLGTGASPEFTGLTLTGGTPGSGKVWTSDGSGAGSWETPSGSLPQGLDTDDSPTFDGITTTGAVVRATRVVSSTPDSVQSDDHVLMISVTGDSTVNLPDSPSNGREVRVTNISTGIVTINAGASETILGESSYSLDIATSSVILVAIGSMWCIF